MNSVEVRQKLVDALRLDLIGPDPARGLGTPDEVLPQWPSRWYLGGFLVPLEAPEEQRSEEGSDDELDAMAEAGGTDDATTPEPAAGRRAYMPSSIGLSVLVPNATRQLKVTVRWGDYKVVSGPLSVVSGPLSVDRGPLSGVSGPLSVVSGPLSVVRCPLTVVRCPVSGVSGPLSVASGPLQRTTDNGQLTTDSRQLTTLWQRTAREEHVALDVPDRTPMPIEKDVPRSAGLKVALMVRPVQSDGQEGGLPRGTRSVSVFLVNRRRPAPDETRDEAFAFQAQLEIAGQEPLVPRPDLRSLESQDWDDRVADLQYRDAFEYAVGHSVAAEAVKSDGRCHVVRTCWIPEAEVERVAPAKITGVELSMEALADLASPDDARARLGGFVEQHRQWIEAQRDAMPQSPQRRKETAEELLRLAGIAADRIERGIALLADPRCLDAFKIANRAMAKAAKQRAVVSGQLSVDSGPLSVISLPDRDETVKKAVDSVWEFVAEVEDQEQLRYERKKARVKAGLEGLTDEEVFHEILARRGTVLGEAKTVKQAELETLIAAKEGMGEDKPDGTFHARAIPRERWDAPWMQKIERVVAVHRLREVMALVGFTRFEALAPDTDGELEIGVRRAALARELSWLPAVENRGEGIFVQFKHAEVEAWLQRSDVLQRGLKLKSGFDCWLAERSNSRRKWPYLSYYLLHSFSHLLLTAVALERGYPASSIRERIYSSPGTGYGVLLYTATSDAEGTLGGLVEAGRRIHEHIRAALDMGELCSNDPVCAQHEPQNAHERRFLHGAACHGCVLVAETSCEQHNDFLDRTLVVPTVDNLGIEFFKT